MTPTEGAILEVDLSAVVANWRLLGQLHRGAVGAVIKADGYGLGAVPLARVLHAAGCRHFFVAHLREALPLRPVLAGCMLAVLNGLTPDSEECYLRHELDPVLGSLEAVDRWAAQARRLGRALPALLHVDTGMNRLGLGADDVAALGRDPARLAGIDLRFIMTHMIASELPDDATNAAQRERFARACAALPAAPRSLANSSAIFLGDGWASDLARPGAALYGINPTPGRPNPMLSVVRLRAPVLQLRDIEPGETVGYNGLWRAARPSRIATVGIGYADGWKRSLSGRGHAFFDGTPAPLVGRISMDLATYDVTDLPALRAGAMLELIGPDMPVDEVAEAAGTNAYEILTSLAPRIGRSYRA
jgi:alanine racemase